MRRRTRLGWNDFFQEQIAHDAPPPHVARIIEEQRGAYRVAGDFDGWAEVSGKFRHDAQDDRRFSGCWRLGVSDPACGPGTRLVITRRLESAQHRSRAQGGRPRRRRAGAGGQRRHDLPRHRAR